MIWKKSVVIQVVVHCMQIFKKAVTCQWNGFFYGKNNCFRLHNSLPYPLKHTSEDIADNVFSSAFLIIGVIKPCISEILSELKHKTFQESSRKNYLLCSHCDWYVNWPRYGGLTFLIAPISCETKKTTPNMLIKVYRMCCSQRMYGHW